MSALATPPMTASRRDVLIADDIPDAVVEGQRTTVGVHMVGDPWINPVGGLLGWRQAQYATAMAQKAGLIGADASGLDALSGGRDTVVFVLAGTGVEVAHFTIPDRVMAFEPYRHPLRLSDQQEHGRGRP